MKGEGQEFSPEAISLRSFVLRFDISAHNLHRGPANAAHVIARRPERVPRICAHVLAHNLHAMKHVGREMFRRHLPTNTIWACNGDTTCRRRRIFSVFATLHNSVEQYVICLIQYRVKHASSKRHTIRHAIACN
jgi:hypothetical protein